MQFTINYQYLAFALFFIFVIFYWIYAFVTLYHLTRFGVGTQPKKFAAIFLIGSMVIFCVSVIIFATININGTSEQIKNLLERARNSSQYNA